MNYLKHLSTPTLMVLFILNPLLATTYEDAENQDVSAWIVYDNIPAGATITNIMDQQKNSRVIQLDGAGRSNSYALGARTGDRAWNNNNEKTLQWSMNAESKYKLYIYLETTEGLRYLYYSYHDKDKGLISNKYVHYGLGSDSKDGQWHTYTRDLEKDLKKYEPNNSIVAVNGFRLQGDAKVDDIKLINNDQPPHMENQLIVPTDYDTLELAITHAKDGDTIILNPGTYFISENIKVKQKNLTIASKYHTTGDKSYINSTIITGIGAENIKGHGDKSSKRFLEAESSDLKIIGVTGKNFGKFIIFTEGNNNLVDHCHLTNMDADSVSFDATAGGKVFHSIIEFSGDDAIDVDSKVQGEFEFAYNTLLNSHDDGIEIHLWKDKRHKIVNTMHYNIHDNVIKFSHKDAIQLIDYADTTNRAFTISNNTFSDNGHVAVGAIFEKTNHSLAETNFSGTDMKESVKILNNIFDNNKYHILGGSNMEVKGNTFKNASKVAIKRVKGESIIQNNTFSNNKVNRLDSN